MIKIPDIPVSAITKIGGGQGSPFQNALLPSVPPALLNVPAGTLVNALVTGSGPGGIFTLQTPYGQLSIRTTLPLQQNNVLEFRLASPEKNLGLLLVSINNQPVNKPPGSKTPDAQGTEIDNPPEDFFLFTVAPKNRQPPQPQSQPTPAVTTGTPSFTQGDALQATLSTVREGSINTLLGQFTWDAPTGKFIPVTPGAANAGVPTDSIIKPGAQFSFRLVEIALPVPASSQTIPVIQTTSPVLPAAVSEAVPNPGTLPALNTAPGTPASAAPLSGDEAVFPTPPQLLQTPPSSNTLARYATATPADIVAENTLPNPVVPETVSNRINGLPLVAATVISTDKSSTTLLSTPFGTLQLHTDKPLAKNTTLYLEVTAISLAPPPVQPNIYPNSVQQVAPDSIPQLMKHWASLDEAIKTVQQTAPEVAAKTLETLPAPDKNLGAKLTHFINALQTGSVSEWLGPEFVRVLQQQKKTELLTQLTKEFSTLRNALAEAPATTNWQTLVFPVIHEGALQQARMYIRVMREDEKQQQNGREKGANARFVVEVDLERLGSMQLDGLVKQVENGKFFDLVIRSYKPLDNDIIDGIREIFINVQEVTGLKGRVAFENTTRFPVNPLDEILASEAGNSIVV